MNAAWRAFRIYRTLLIGGQLVLIGIMLHHSTHPFVVIFAAASAYELLRRVGRRRWRW